MPELAEFAARRPGWFFEWVDTQEAARATGISAATLESLRSRGGGPPYNVPEGSSSVRYMRLYLYKWMVAGGLYRHTGDGL